MARTVTIKGVDSGIIGISILGVESTNNWMSTGLGRC